MTSNEILAIIEKYIHSSENESVTNVLTQVKSDIELQVQAEIEAEQKPNGRCKVCGKDSGRLMKRLYCMDCYDLLID